MAKLLTTAEQMRNVTRTVKHYFISKYFPAHEARAHNDRWIEPAQWRTIEVDEGTYKRTKRSEQRRIDTEIFDVPYEEFVSHWEKEFESTLQWFERNPNLTSAKSAIFAVKQYGYILDVKISNFLFVNDEFTSILLKSKKAEREAIGEILEILKSKLDVLEEKAEEKRKEKAIRDAEIAELKRLKKIAKMEKDMERMKREYQHLKEL